MMALSSLLGAGDETKQRAYLGAGDTTADGRRETGSYPQAVLARVAAAVFARVLSTATSFFGGGAVFGGIFGGSPGIGGGNSGLGPGGGPVQDTGTIEH